VTRQGLVTLRKYRKAIIGFLCFLLIWFVWFYNWRPFKINSEINIAVIFAENKMCEQAIEKMEQILPEKSFLDGYLRSKYSEILLKCQEQMSEHELLLMKKNWEITKENVNIHPYSTRSYILLGSLSNFLAEKETNSEFITELKKEAVFYLEKAIKLSPKRPDAIPYLVQAYAAVENYAGLAETYPKLIEIEPDNAQYYASLAFVYKELGQIKEAKKTALKIIELFPEHQQAAEEFLQTLE